MASSLPFPNRYHVAQKRVQWQQAQQPVPWTPGDVAAREPASSMGSLLDRRQSKLGLRNVFARTKTDSQVFSIVPVADQGDSACLPPSPRSKHMPILAGPDLAVKSMDRPASFLSNKLRQPSSSEATEGHSGSPTLYSPLGSSKTSSSTSTTTAKPKHSRNKTTWEPPPLFQAYAQAIKYATLSTPSLPADTVLRMAGSKKAGSSEVQASPAGPRDDPEHSGITAGTSTTRHRRRFSGSIPGSDGSQRVYLLTKSGHILQYARDGPFDRLPEKTLRLGKHSVAFASDAIPGKHWVLQVSQSMHSDGTSSSDSRSLFSRLPFWNSDTQKTTSTLLMILDNAKELDGWISLVRREIELFGGDKRVTETGKPRSAESMSNLLAQPNPHPLIGRDPHQLSGHVSSEQIDFVEKLDLETMRSWMSHAQNPSSEDRPGDRTSTITSLASCDDLQLDSLRNSTYRDSYMSSGQRTFLTSRSSSPSSSPVLANHLPSPIFVDRLTHASKVTERRSSVPTLLQGSSDYAMSSFQTRSQSTMYENSMKNRIEKPRRTTDVTVTRGSRRAEKTERNLPSLRSVDFSGKEVNYSEDNTVQTSSQTDNAKRSSPPKGQKIRCRDPPVTAKSSSLPPVKARVAVEQHTLKKAESDRSASPFAMAQERSLPLRCGTSYSDISVPTASISPYISLSRRRRYSAASFVLQQSRPMTGAQPIANKRLHAAGCSAPVPPTRIDACDSPVATEHGDSNLKAGALRRSSEVANVPIPVSKSTNTVSSSSRFDSRAVAAEHNARHLLNSLPPAPPPSRALPPLPPMRLLKPRRVSAVRQSSAVVVVDHV